MSRSACPSSSFGSREMATLSPHSARCANPRVRSRERRVCRFRNHLELNVTRRFPARDQVAIVGVGTTPFSRDSGRSELSLVVEACQNAIRDAGLTRDDIDGLSGDIFRNEIVQSALGIPETGWSVSCLTAFNIQMTNAMMAVASGVCETVLVHHSMYRTPMLSASAAKDPFRKRVGTFIGTRRPQSHWPDSIAGEASVYAPWARKYFDTYKAR